MEFKKKTIIWEDNNEPPKDYIWAKKDGKFYEYSYATRSWAESKTVSGGNSGESGGSGGGDEGSSTDPIVDAITDFKITIKKDKSGFFTTNGEPLNNTNEAKAYYSSDSTPDSFGEAVSLEEYFDISDMDVFKGLCGLLKRMDSFATEYYENFESEVKIALDTSDALGDWSNMYAGVALSRKFDWDGGTGTLNPCVILSYWEYGQSSSYYPHLYLYLDPSDPTKFYAKPGSNEMEE